MLATQSALHCSMKTIMNRGSRGLQHHRLWIELWVHLAVCSEFYMCELRLAGAFCADIAINLKDGLVFFLFVKLSK